MTARSYKSLAFSWVPDSQEKRSFYLITAIVMLCAGLLGFYLGSVELPPAERKAREAVPERVARFINQQKKPPPPPPEARPTPRPIPSPKPKVARQRDAEKEKAPLTESEKKAREKASESGLLALGNELADLIDSTEVSQLVNTRVNSASANARRSAGVDTDVLTAGVGQGSGGVASSDFVSGVGRTQLSQREVALVRQSLLKKDEVAITSAAGGDTSAARSGRVRSEEEVTIVFDQNKGQLFSIYNRERRKKPGLKGKIVLEITIAPDGSVTNVRIASSELNDPALERRLLARVRQFQFEAKDVESVTVTFPIEFLPS